MAQRGELPPDSPSTAANLTIRLRPVGELSIGVPHESAPQLLHAVTLGVTMGGPGWTLWAGTAAGVPLWLVATLALVQAFGGVAVLCMPRRATVSVTTPQTTPGKRRHAGKDGSARP